MARTTRRTGAPTMASRAPKLNDKQRIALEAELNGKSVAEAAKEAGVSRQTVSEWRNHDFEYRAARNAAAWDQLGDLATTVRKELLTLALDDLRRDLGSDDPATRQRARTDVMRYERQLPEPPSADPDAERKASMHRTLAAMAHYDASGGVDDF